MPRFFFPDMPSGELIALPDEIAGHIRVLRMKAGERFTLCDGKGLDLQCALSEAEFGAPCAKVLSSGLCPAEPPVFVRVLAAFPKQDKAEHIIQKAVELGASEIVFFPSSRCVSRPDENALPKKLLRWNKISLSAAEQSGRGIIPQVAVSPSFESALELAAKAEMPLFLYEDERELSLKDALSSKPFKTAAILSGPEGGFSGDEALLAGRAGLISVSLGPRILRCETAPLCGLSALMFFCGGL